jgi:DNA-binding MarR family transcriptional regulator
MGKDTQGELQTQVDSSFSADDAKLLSGFIPIPLGLARTIGAATQTLGAMFKAFRQDGRTISRSQSELAESAGVTDRTFRRHLRILEDADLITTIGEFRQPNRHKLEQTEQSFGEWLPMPRYALEPPWHSRLVLAYVVYRSQLSECGNACTDGLRAMSRDLGIDRRNVKDAIARLVADGFIEQTDGDPATLWLRPPPEAPGVICPGPRGLSVRDPGGNLSDYRRNGLRSGSKNHTPVVSSRKLTKITEADLRDDAALTGQFLKAVRLGIIPDSGQARLRFWTAACHALRVGDHPAAMFSWIIHGEHWGHSTDADEDAALDRLRSVGV